MRGLTWIAHTRWAMTSWEGLAAPVRYATMGMRFTLGDAAVKIRTVLLGLCLVPLLAGAGIADEALSASDLAYLAKIGVKPENLTIGNIDIWQKAHLHYLINDPGIQNRDAEVNYFLDYAAMCAKMLDRAGVTPVSCDYAPPGHP
jgi:hypothetical protein